MPEAEALVASWRARHDEAARTGVPAHVTLLYPFMAPSRIGADDVAQLGALFAATPPISFTLARVQRFPGVVYLAPEPDDIMRELTRQLWARYPEHPPYGGQFPAIVPHLTVAQSKDPEVLDAVEAAMTPGLPISCHVGEAWLMAVEGAQARWHTTYRFPLLGRPEP